MLSASFWLPQLPCKKSHFDVGSSCEAGSIWEAQDKWGLCSLFCVLWCRREEVPFTEAAQQEGDGEAVIQDADAADGQAARVCLGWGHDQIKPPKE